MYITHVISNTRLKTDTHIKRHANKTQKLGLRVSLSVIFFSYIWIAHKKDTKPTLEIYSNRHS